MFRNTQRHMLRHPTSIALSAVVNSVTADGCVHITESVGSRRELVTNSCTHRRRDATRQFRLLTSIYKNRNLWFRRVGGVYWALHWLPTDWRIKFKIDAGRGGAVGDMLL